jgi:replicative DNA helicase
MTITFSFLQVLFHNPHLFSDTRLTADHFPEGRERNLFTTMQEIYRNGGIVDEAALKQQGIDFSDSMDLGNYCDIVTANWRHREKEIIDLYNRKKIHLLAETILNDKISKPAELIELWQSETAMMENTTGFEIRTMDKAVMETYNAIVDRMEKGGSLVGISSGLNELDRATLGFQNRNLYYIGARPSQGKTALLLNFMNNCPVPCGIISAESGMQELTTRLLSMESGLDTQRLSAGLLNNNQVDSLNNHATTLYERKAFVYDEPNLSIDRLSMVARQMVTKYGVKIIFVDYIQILAPSASMKNRPIRETVVFASKQLKQLARTLDVPVVCAAQLNRSSDEGRPKLSQFSESAQIEQDADVAVLIWNKTSKDNEDAGTYLLVEKNRNGRRGDIPVLFDRSCLRFQDKRY